MRYCPATLGALQALGVPKDGLKSAKNPLTGGYGYWVPQEYWDVIHDHNLELWEEPLVFVTHHLEAVTTSEPRGLPGRARGREHAGRLGRE